MTGTAPKTSPSFATPTETISPAAAISGCPKATTRSPPALAAMKVMAAAPKLLEALDYLLAQTVDMDLKYGITLSEGEEDARAKALSAIADATGRAA